MCAKITNEKDEILSLKGNVLVVANPGTGKTYLLGKKFVKLIKEGIKPEDILCLTFTSKARGEMEERIIKFLAEEKLNIDLSKLNIFTFHAFALDSLSEEKIISSNLLRFVIFDFLKEKQVLNYEDNYLIETIVPKLENLMRYLKSYGVTPDKIDKSKVKKLIEAYETSKDTIDREEVELFLDYFVEIFKQYENVKNRKGVDYSDLLIRFLDLKKKPFFNYVLIDELQDVNRLEAEIALISGETFFAVGDKKQSIFGFQGGSTENFVYFSSKNPSERNLRENRRSTQQILDFASKDYCRKTLDKSCVEELKGLKSCENLTGPKPVIYEIEAKDFIGAVCSLVNEIKLGTNSKGKPEKLGILVRTNNQVNEIALALTSRNISFSSTYFAASEEARNNIILFLRAVFSEDIVDVKNSFFTPFFPLSTQESFKLSAKKDLTLEEVLKVCPAFKEIRESVKNISDVQNLFDTIIFPVSVAYGEEHLLAAQALLESSQEAISILDEKSLHNFSLYLQSCDLLSNVPKKESQVVISTVHKSKGLEYDKVIYLPRSSTKKDNFYDYIVEKILESKNIDAKSELEEETLRVDFVAFTRAEKELYIITPKATDYLNELIEQKQIVPQNISTSFAEKQKKAYALFVGKDYDNAKKLLEKDSSWLKEYIQAHFKSLEHISFSNLKTDPYVYLTQSILGIREPSEATNLGTIVHEALEAHLKNEKPELTEEAIEYYNNGIEMIREIKKEYPELVSAEEKILVPIQETLGIKDPIQIKGKIDAIFKNKSEYLIVDWKTSKSTNNASEYRQQLELYRQIYGQSQGISPEKIKVAIGFVGIRKMINDGTVHSKYDNAQPRSTAIQTLKKHLQTFIEWRQNPDNFFKALQEKTQYKTEPLYRAIIEQYKKED